MAFLQFGKQRDGLNYGPRTGAYGLLCKDGLIGCVRIGCGPYEYDFPGGGVDPGEAPEAAVVREFAEETGLKVRVTGAHTEIDNYFINDDGKGYNNHSHFFVVEMTGMDISLKVEADHELVWLEPHDALLKLKHDGYAYALLTWLRGPRPA